MIGEVPAEFDALIERLNERLPDRLQEEPTPTARVAALRLPGQMVALKRSLVDFLNRIFEPTRYHANATLRGFYFTSGTQEGTPIDQLIGAMSRNFGAEQVGAVAYSGLGKSFFLTDLLPEGDDRRGRLGVDQPAAVRRSLLIRPRPSPRLGACVFAARCIGLWWMSFIENRDAHRRDRTTAIADYRTLAQPRPAADDGLRPQLRQGPAARCTSCATCRPATTMRDEPMPIAATFGLSQRQRLAVGVGDGLRARRSSACSARA